MSQLTDDDVTYIINKDDDDFPVAPLSVDEAVSSALLSSSSVVRETKSSSFVKSVSSSSTATSAAALKEGGGGGGLGRLEQLLEHGGEVEDGFITLPGKVSSFSEDQKINKNVYFNVFIFLILNISCGYRTNQFRF